MSLQEDGYAYTYIYQHSRERRTKAECNGSTPARLQPLPLSSSAPSLKASQHSEQASSCKVGSNGFCTEARKFSARAACKISPLGQAVCAQCQTHQGAEIEKLVQCLLGTGLP